MRTLEDGQGGGFNILTTHPGTVSGRPYQVLIDYARGHIAGLHTVLDYLSGECTQ
jgi:hypothetical protein